MEDHLLETVLQQCAAAAPDPWYPSFYLQAAGVSHELLDPALDRLRMSGLIRLTDWTQGKGQGYVLTPLGMETVAHPGRLARVRQGQLPTPPQPRPVQPASDRSWTAWDRGEAARAALSTPSTPTVTFILIFANVLWFLAGLVIAHQEHVPAGDYLFPKAGKDEGILHQLGAVKGDDIYRHHQWWRLLACCFVHIGLIHLAVNMYSLYAVGPLLEQLWGSWRFLVLYLIAGLGGSCALVIENPVAGGAGASGALWGILASLATWLFFHRKVINPALAAHWRRSLIWLFILNLGITFTVSQISKGAHLGGGLVGLVAAVPMDYLRFGTRRQRGLALAALLLIPALCVGALLLPIGSFGRSEQADRARLGRALPLVVRWNDLLISANRLTKSPQVRLSLQAPPATRSNEDVQEAVRELSEKRQALIDLIEQLEALGAYNSAEFEQDRQLRIEAAQKMSDILEAMRTHLEQRQEWTSDDDRKIQPKKKDVREIFEALK